MLSSDCSQCGADCGDDYPAERYGDERVRSGIRSLLEAEDDIEVVAEAADGRQAVTLAAEHRPDIALVDIQMPVLNGVEATRQIVADERLDSVRVVILTNFGLDEYIFAALQGAEFLRVVEQRLVFGELCVGEPSGHGLAADLLGLAGLS